MNAVINKASVIIVRGAIGAGLYFAWHERMSDKIPAVTNWIVEHNQEMIYLNYALLALAIYAIGYWVLDVLGFRYFQRRLHAKQAAAKAQQLNVSKPKGDDEMTRKFEKMAFAG